MLSIGVCEVPAPKTMLAIDVHPYRSFSAGA
jgi:hypothetical protein